MTIFNGQDSPEWSLLEILDEVELHHGAYSHDAPVSAIYVLGTQPTEEIRHAFADLGFTEIGSAINGFTARRPA